MTNENIERSNKQFTQWVDNMDYLVTKTIIEYYNDKTSLEVFKTLNKIKDRGKI